VRIPVAYAIVYPSRIMSVACSRSRSAGNWQLVLGTRFERFAHLTRQIVGSERLLDKRGPWIESAAINGGIFRVSGHVKNRQPVANRGNLRDQFASLDSGHDHVV
jgi:hypothetical protein